jgi:hypothetical protein
MVRKSSIYFFLPQLFAFYNPPTTLHPLSSSLPQQQLQQQQRQLLQLLYPYLSAPVSVYLDLSISKLLCLAVTLPNAASQSLAACYDGSS